MPDPTSPTGELEPPGRKPFAMFVQEQRGGALHAELSEALAELVAACLEHDKSGTLTLKINVAPTKAAGTVQVSDDVTLKAPQGSRGAALFFTDSSGNLSRRNPAQPELPLREIAATRPDAPARELDTPTDQPHREAM